MPLSDPKSPARVCCAALQGQQPRQQAKLPRRNYARLRWEGITCERLLKHQNAVAECAVTSQYHRYVLSTETSFKNDDIYYVRYDVRD